MNLNKKIGNYITNKVVTVVQNLIHNIYIFKKWTTWWETADD